MVVTSLMFLAGIFFKMPSVKLFTVMGKDIELPAFLPTQDAVGAMNKILLSSASFQDILPEFMVLALLSLGYFLGGGWLFGWRYTRKTA